MQICEIESTISPTPDAQAIDARNDLKADGGGNVQLKKVILERVSTGKCAGLVARRVG
jgi:hypothetical protein